MTETNFPRLGEVLRDGGQVRLRYTRRIAHAPARVWRALTESSELRHWFPADLVGDRRVGAPLRVTMWPEAVERAPDEVLAAGMDLADATLPGEIRAWDPPRLFEYTWGADVLRWELVPDGDGTLLVFTTWVAEPAPSTYSDIAAGYHVCLDALETLLDTGGAVVDDSEAIGELQRHYQALLDSD